MSAEVKTFPQDEVTRQRGELTMIEVIEGARTPAKLVAAYTARDPATRPTVS